MLFNKSYNSPNYSIRSETIKFIVVHYTELNFDQSLKILCSTQAKVSSHYIIKDDGEIFQLVDDKYSSWHAGLSYWRGLDKINDHSIGIELDNSGRTSFSQKLMLSCINLCKKLMQQYNIHAHNVIGHSDIAPSRKIDPGLFFNWQALAAHGIGLWIENEYDHTNNYTLYKYGDDGQKIKDLQLRLNLIGYNCKASSQYDKATSDVVRAFKAHFNAINITQATYWELGSLYDWDKISDMILNELSIIKT